MTTLESPKNNTCSGALQVLAAASSLFSERGVDAVSMQDIATAAAVSKANVFHHFENKEQLYLAVLRSKVDAQDCDISDLIASPAPFAQRFLALMQRQLGDMLRDEPSTKLVMREIVTGNAIRAKLMATQIFTAKVKERIAFFEDARARGELRADADPHLCEMLLGACCMFHFNCRGVSQHISAELGTPALDTPEAFASAVCALLMEGFAASRPPAGRRLRSQKSSTCAIVVDEKVTTTSNRHSRSS